jgi:hypothetical protein
LVCRDNDLPRDFSRHQHFPTKKACGLRVIRERVAPVVRQTWIDPLATAHSTEEGIRAIFREISDELETAGRRWDLPLLRQERKVVRSG